MSENRQTIIPWLTAAVIIGAIGIGLYFIGGPSHARATKNDRARITNLADTAKVIACYVDVEGKLPADMAAVKEVLQTGDLQVSKFCNRLKFKDDPVTYKPFEFVPLGKKTFELCAVFELPSEKEASYNSYRYSSSVFVNLSVERKEAGRFCYLAKNWDKRR